MKRKEYQDIYESFSHIDLSSPSSKSRRLDPELLAYGYGVPISCTVPEVVEPLPQEQGRQEQHLPGSTDSLGDDFCRVNDEKAIVLFNPANTPLFKSPNCSDFSVVVRSDLIPGLKEHIFSLEKAKTDKTLNDSLEKTAICASDNSLAVVPWVASAAWAASPPKPVEPEEVEMMDVENEGTNGSSGPAAELDGGLQQWQQQHCLRPEPVHNTWTPVAW